MGAPGAASSSTAGRPVEGRHRSRRRSGGRRGADRTRSGRCHGSARGAGPREPRTAPALPVEHWPVCLTGGEGTVIRVPKEQIHQPRPSDSHVLVALWMHKDDLHWQRKNPEFKVPRPQQPAHNDAPAAHRLTWVKMNAKIERRMRLGSGSLMKARAKAPMGTSVRRGQTVPERGSVAQCIAPAAVTNPFDPRARMLPMEEERPRPPPAAKAALQLPVSEQSQRGVEVPRVTSAALDLQLRDYMAPTSMEVDPPPKSAATAVSAAASAMAVPRPVAIKAAPRIKAPQPKPKEESKSTES